MAIQARRGPDTPTPGDGYVQSFARGLDVIRSFSDTAPTQTLSEVAARSGLSRAGARRLLLTLQTLGYVETDGKIYYLTPRVLDLGFAYLTSMPIWNLAEPVMERLADTVGESCLSARAHPQNRCAQFERRQAPAGLLHLAGSCASCRAPRYRGEIAFQGKRHQSTYAPHCHGGGGNSDAFPARSSTRLGSGNPGA